MTTIRTACLLCHTDVELGPGDVSVYLPDRYSFECPTCCVTSWRHCNDRVIRVLTTVGCDVLGPITEAEIVAFAAELETL